MDRFSHLDISLSQKTRILSTYLCRSAARRSGLIALKMGRSSSRGVAVLVVLLVNGLTLNRVISRISSIVILLIDGTSRLKLTLRVLLSEVTWDRPSGSKGSLNELSRGVRLSLSGSSSIGSLRIHSHRSILHAVVVLISRGVSGKRGVSLLNSESFRILLLRSVLSECIERGSDSLHFIRKLSDAVS